jgi:septal ring factor EnvC (AmiA/AmiB activator)
LPLHAEIGSQIIAVDPAPTKPVVGITGTNLTLSELIAVCAALGGVIATLWKLSSNITRAITANEQDRKELQDTRKKLDEYYKKLEALHERLDKDINRQELMIRSKMSALEARIDELNGKHRQLKGIVVRLVDELKLKGIYEFTIRRSSDDD